MQSLATGHPVPELIIADWVQTMPAQDPLSPSVELCRDARGELLAYCRTEGGTIAVDLPDLASFSFEPGAGRVMAVPHRLLPRAFVVETYHHCVLPLVLPALGVQVLHASAVASPAGVTALCGESGTGKSTMAVALGGRGYNVWADDAVAVDTDQPGPMAIQLPFKVRLRPGSDRFLTATSPQVPSTSTAAAGTEPRPLVALCLLRRASDATAAVTVERLEPAAACQMALAHAYCFSVRDAAQKRRTISSYLTLTGRASIYEIRFRPGVEHLPAVLDTIEGLIGD